MKVYLAGPLFTDYERGYVADCAAALRRAGLEVFVPHEQSFPAGELTPTVVFAKDNEGLLPAHAVLAVLDGPMVDDGTACEIGIFHGMKLTDPSKKGVVGLLTDSRLVGSGGRSVEGRRVNLYVAGCIEAAGSICTNLDDALQILLQWKAELEAAPASQVNSMSSSPAVIVVGSTMMDMIAYTDRMPADGETIAGKRFSLGFGGKGANQAVMARRLGGAVTMVNCLGDDVFGDMTLANLGREGIDTSAITRASDTSSGVAPIWVDAAGSNRIIVVPGANHHMTAQQATGAVADAPRADAVIGQFEIPREVTLAGFRAARERGAITVLNPAPAGPLPAELLAVTDFLVPNEVEFAQIIAEHVVSDQASDTDLLTAGPVTADSITDVVLRTAADRLGVTLIVTLGSAGAAIAMPGQDVIRVAAPVVAAVDTTGAGDAFVGAFSYAVAAGWSVPDAARLGCACASDSVTRAGTQSSYPNHAEATKIVAAVASSANFQMK
ncbi:MAG: PfkB family carbohydrate kinase [Nakamurella sp.]